MSLDLKEVLIRNDVLSRPLEDFPEDKELRYQLACRVADAYFQWSKPHTIEDLIEEIGKEMIFTYLIDWLQNYRDFYIEMEAQMWVDGDYNYLMDERDFGDDWNYYQPNGTTKQTMYSLDEIKNMGIKISDVVKCFYVKDGWPKDNIEGFSLLEVQGCLDGIEAQICRGDGNSDEFYQWYDTLSEEDKDSIDNADGCHNNTNFRSDCTWIRAGDSEGVIAWYIDNKLMYERIKGYEEAQDAYEQG